MIPDASNSKNGQANGLSTAACSAFILAGWIRAESKYYEQFQRSDEDNDKILQKFNSQNSEMMDESNKG